MGVEQGLHSPDPGADHDGEAVALHRGGTGVGPGLLRGDERQLLAAVEPVRTDPPERPLGVECGIGPDPDRHLRPQRSVAVRARTPERPATRASQSGATPWPNG